MRDRGQARRNELCAIAPALRVGIVAAALTPILACDPAVQSEECTVAWLNEEPISIPSALAMTASQTPPPPRTQRLRLAVDVEVAARERGITSALPGDRMDAYRAWLLDAGARREAWGSVAEAMRAARARHGFRPGPCYPDASAEKRPGSESIVPSSCRSPGLITNTDDLSWDTQGMVSISTSIAGKCGKVKLLNNGVVSTGVTAHGFCYYAGVDDEYPN